MFFSIFHIIPQDPVFVSGIFFFASLQKKHENYLLECKRNPGYCPKGFF